MNKAMSLKALFGSEGSAAPSAALLALLTLGILESLDSGLLSVTDSVRLFFHAENCLYVRDNLHDRIAEEIMSRGVQLPDVFESLPTEEAQREFQREVTAMRRLCLKLLEEERLAA